MGHQNLLKLTEGRASNRFTQFFRLKLA